MTDAGSAGASGFAVCERVDVAGAVADIGRLPYEQPALIETILGGWQGERSRSPPTSTTASSGDACSTRRPVNWASRR